MFDHVGIAVSNLAASERSYRTVLSVLGVEPSYASPELAAWEDWALVVAVNCRTRVTRSGAIWAFGSDPCYRAI
ncbi:MAG: hypothetical protein ACR2OB_01620 [Solirubrobacteraceae bacterium]